MTETVIRVSEPRELLSYVPHRLGFRPRESLVAVSLRGAAGRVGLVLRVDLDDLADDVRGDDLAAQVARHLRDDGARSVVLVAYTGAPRMLVRTAGCPAGSAVARAGRALGGLVRDVWHVGPDGYAGLHCESEACCPAPGRPLSDLESTRIGAHLVFRGSVVAGSRAELACRDRAPEPARRAAARAAAAERAQVRRLQPSPEEPASGTALAKWRAAGVERWWRLLEGHSAGVGPPPPELGRLLVALEDVVARDGMLLTLAPTTAGSDAAGDVPAALSAVLGPGGLPPDPDVHAAACAVLQDVVAHSPRGRAAPPLAALAWLAWWSGDGARAAVLVDQACAADPGHRLARLLAVVIGHGIPPGWVRAVADDDTRRRPEVP